jgi:hypothetical protein
MKPDEYKRLRDEFGPKRMHKSKNSLHPQTDSSTIPMFGGRPERDTRITKDEIIGLIIDLETLNPEDLNYRYFGIAA